MTQTFTQIIERISHWQLSQEERAAIFGVESQLRGLEYAITINKKTLAEQNRAINYCNQIIQSQAAHIARITQAHTNLATKLAELTCEVRGGKPDTTAYDFLADQMTELKQALGKELERQRQRDIDAAKDDPDDVLDAILETVNQRQEQMEERLAKLEKSSRRTTPRRATTRKKAS